VAPKSASPILAGFRYAQGSSANEGGKRSGDEGIAIAAGY
jgi:hypothetical protein